MKIFVYVEGVSDKVALEALLRPIIDDLPRARRPGLSFLPRGGKAAILNDVPLKAALHLKDKPGDWVIALPDLYPMAHYDNDPAMKHRSIEQLRELLGQRFRKESKTIGVLKSAQSHFCVHCLKHDLEALILASPDQLRERLGTKDALKNAWRNPVEDQNDDTPPKRVVERLFKNYKKQKYRDTVDAPWILERASLSAIRETCPQCFDPFVSDLLRIAGDCTDD
jgi:hypothetical protein